MKNIDFVACHRKPERSFFYKGQQFPLCARCTGIYVGFLIMPLLLFNMIQLSLMLSLALIAPCVLDGFVQSQTTYISNNYLRLATGLTAGVGLIGLTIVAADACFYLVF